MMDCTHYRRALLAQPHDPDAALAEHRRGCGDCNLFTERLMRFEMRLGRAMQVSLPAGKADFPLDMGSRRLGAAGFAANRSGWLAMAASVLLAAVVAGGLWLIVPGRSLAADVVTHMAEEPQAWVRTDEPVPGPALQAVLRDSHLRLAGAGIVSYAASCGFRGHHVPHLVIQTESGPVTVMVLVHERASRTVQFDEQGYRGVIVPVPGHGSLAVLTRGTALDPAAIDRIAHQVQSYIVWSG